MKLIHLVYIISFFVLSSCSSTAIVSNHWVNYLNSNSENTILTSSVNNTLLKTSFKLIDSKEFHPNKDSIVIVTKTGKIYRGIVSKSDFDGYFIMIKNNREVYVSNLEIKSIQFFKNPTFINTQSLAVDPKPDSAIIKNNISIEKVVEPSNNSSLENDVWDNTNSEFETPKTNFSKPPIQSEQSVRKKVQEPFSIASLIALILSPFTLGLGFLLAFIFSIVSMSRIRNNSEKYKGRTLARILFGICLAVSLIVIFAVALLLALW
jgi:hypothetical protein